ncbi:MAG: hypothetical protein ACI4KB_10570 [Oscillospiraceae bacterium]|nr:hypothetical protein [Oscillospiraceae bacterium]
MRETFDQEIINKMFENKVKMKKIRTSYSTMLFMSTAILIIQLIFMIVGGLNVYMLEGILFNAVVFYIGTQKFSNTVLQYVLMALNLIAAAAFLIWHPVSEILLRIGIMQHLYLAVEMYLFIRLGAQKEELSYELGYPYFTEIAAYQHEDKDYVPENDIHSGSAEMNQISESENISSDLSVEKREGVWQNAGMDTISSAGIPMEFTSDAVRTEHNLYSEMYSQKPQAVQKEPEYDRELLRINRGKMKNFKIFQKMIFITDAVITLIVISNTIGAICNMMNEPLGIFVFLQLLGVIIASVITVTCLDNRTVIKSALYAFTTSGFFFTIIFMDMSYAFFFLAFTVQMLISSKLADIQDYLKTQFGYPYFQENMIIKQYHTSEYAPEHKINFRNNGMDEL